VFPKSYLFVTFTTGEATPAAEPSVSFALYRSFTILDTKRSGLLIAVGLLVGFGGRGTPFLPWPARGPFFGRRRRDFLSVIFSRGYTSCWDVDSPRPNFYIFFFSALSFQLIVDCFVGVPIPRWDAEPKTPRGGVAKQGRVGQGIPKGFFQRFV